MLESVLIANRGEIARRIIRTARRLGVRTVAVHSDVDAALPFVREADAAVCIGPAPAKDSYLRQDRILDAARRSGAEAIHPGYGFLSENAEFADSVLAAGLVWVGAPPAAIRAMGLKDAAKRRMIEAGVSVTPGYLGEDQGLARLRKEADAIGYPVLIKAVAGGGGKGMRRVDEPSAFEEALASCRREAAAAFGDDRVLIERYVHSPRHIEVQVFGDTHGNIVHLFERDCSLQRRHQKVIEEAPAPGMDAATREAVCAAAVKAAQAVDYVGAGTIEFIADASDGLRADRIWFMEMNTRLQVEHPVTEMITGQDLVEWQLRVASGEPLPKRQEDLSIDGWAMEARLYAETPSTGFLPSTGPLDQLRFPSGIRVDSGAEEGGEVTPDYDPMIAKLIAHAPTRAEAARRLAEAAAQTDVWPVRTNAAFLARAASHPDFLAARIDTGFIERHLDALVPSPDPPEAVLQAAAAALLRTDAGDPWTGLTGFRVNAAPSRLVEVEVADRPYLVELERIPVGSTHPAVIPGGAERRPGTGVLHADPRRAPVPGSAAPPRNDGGVLFLDGEAWPFGPRRSDHVVGAAGAVDGAIIAPMPGRVISLVVREGQAVTRGERLVVIEAMKMEQALVAPFDGRVVELKTREGAQVTEGALLVKIEGEG